MIPGGDLYPTLIRKNPIKPIRIYLQDGEKDLSNEHGNWFLANQQMLSAFEYANAKADKDGTLGTRYEVKHNWGDGAHSDAHGGALLPGHPHLDLDQRLTWKTSRRLQTFTHQSPIGHWSVSVWRTDPRLSEHRREHVVRRGQDRLPTRPHPAFGAEPAADQSRATAVSHRARAARGARALRRRLVLRPAPGPHRHRSSAWQRLVRRGVLGARNVSVAGRAHGWAHRPHHRARGCARGWRACAARAAAEHRLARSALQMRRALAAGAPEASQHRASGGALGRGSHRRERRTHRHRRSGDADRLHAQTPRQPVPADRWA